MKLDGKRLLSALMPAALILMIIFCLLGSAFAYIKVSDERLMRSRAELTNRVLLAVIDRLCPDPSYWIDAFKGQGVPAEYQPYDPARHPTPLSLVDNGEILHVLVRMDDIGSKFGGEVMFFDANNCPLRG